MKEMKKKEQNNLLSIFFLLQICVINLSFYYMMRNIPHLFRTHIYMEEFIVNFIQYVLCIYEERIIDLLLDRDECSIEMKMGAVNRFNIHSVVGELLSSISRRKLLPI